MRQLCAAALLNPEDESFRLVLADWLEEKGWAFDDALRDPAGCWYVDGGGAIYWWVGEGRFRRVGLNMWPQLAFCRDCRGSYYLSRALGWWECSNCRWKRERFGRRRVEQPPSWGAR